LLGLLARSDIRAIDVTPSRAIPQRRRHMPYCTLVEFEWSGEFGRDQFEGLMTPAAEADQDATGRLSRIVGVDDAGARIIEVWRSSGDARAFGERSAPQLATSPVPPPTRVFGFETTEYVVSES